ncbi:peptidoglycan-binding protein [Pedobacter sp. AW31-3R]|uniref:peptidoglycan-binding protein n=1 Tax=Pedobacter sp. AW31-3R TaxID=3445781 RepID=UPI003FA0BB77
MATINLLLCLLCFAFIGSTGLPDRNLLEKRWHQQQLVSQRNELLAIATRELGVRELTGNNDGIRVEAYLACVKLKKGQPWCAAFVSWVYARAGFKAPRTGWSPALFPATRVTKEANPGNVFGVYFSTHQRIAHVGLIKKLDGDWIISLEGNTNSSGSREGDGVYEKRRHIRTIYRIADWVKGKELKK